MRGHSASTWKHHVRAFAVVPRSYAGPPPAAENRAAARDIGLTRTTEEWQASLAFIEYWAACVRSGTVDKFYAQVQFRYSEPMAEAPREAGAEDPEQLARALLALMTGYDTFTGTNRLTRTNGRDFLSLHEPWSGVRSPAAAAGSGW